MSIREKSPSWATCWTHLRASGWNLVWTQYRTYIVGAALLVGLQTALIAALLVQRVRRLRAERASGESERRFRLMADGAPVMVWTAGPDMMCDFFNRRCLEFTGRRMEELLGNGWLECVHPEDADRCVATYVPAFDARSPFRMEYRLRRADGAYRWVLDSGAPRHGPDGGFAGYIGSALDITDRRDWEDALRESQQRLTLATAAGAVGIWDWNFATNELFVDPGLKSLLGFDDREITSRPDDWGSRVHSEDLPAAAALVQACLDGRSDVYEIEHRMLHKDGSVKWFLSRGSAVRAADGTLHRIIGTKVDITERKRAAEQLRLAIEAAPAGMITVDGKGAIVMVNAQVERLFGYDREELINEPVQLLIPRFDNEHAEGRARLLQDDPPLEREGDGLYGVRKDGGEVPIEIGINPFDTPEGELVLMSVVDIADRKRVETENRDLVGQLHHLAGSLIAAQDAERARIARDLHDVVSQQLAALSISLSGLRRRLGGGLREKDLQADVASLQQRTVAIADSVRELSHDLHPDVLRHTGLAEALSSHCDGISREQAIDVACTAEGDFESIDPETAQCLYRIAQEALHNVVKHAGARHVGVRLLRTTDETELAIADDGKGFDIAGTRKSRKGLGLVSITERVRLAGGTLSIVTERNKGTQIRVRLPKSQPASSSAGDASRQAVAN